MKDKFCVSKTLTYLVLLVGAIVATFYATNYANTQKLTSESQASGVCQNSAGVKGFLVNNSNGKTACPVNYTADTKYGDPTKLCCLANSKTAGNLPGMDAAERAAANANCLSQKNKIAAMLSDGKRCTYYTGQSTLQFNRVTCSVAISDDFYACSSGTGKLLNTSTPQTIASICKNLAGKFVPNTTTIEASSNNLNCLVYTGAYRGGNVNVTPMPGEDQTACLRTNVSDVYTANGTYITSKCDANVYLKLTPTKVPTATKTPTKIPTKTPTNVPTATKTPTKVPTPTLTYKCGYYKLNIEFCCPNGTTTSTFDSYKCWRKP